MSRQSDAVKRWRHAVKENAVAAFGGRCELCGYSKSNWALEFHHLNPSEKEFSFGRILARPKNLPTIERELNKCVLVCSNCHKELHAGVTSLPESITTNRPYIKIGHVAPKNEYDMCPVCGKPKPKQNITCSRQCAAKRARKVDWDSVDLKEELKHKSMLELSEELGVSEVAVRKRRRKLGF